MSDLPRPIAELADHLARLPGIGRRAAQRLAFHFTRAPREEAEELARILASLHERLVPCPRCGNLAARGEPCCPICSDPKRDATLLCVVEQADNVEAIERSGAYRGLYHVLGGAIRPLAGVGPDELSIDALLARVDAEDAEFREVILALNPNVEGEATAFYIARLMAGRPLRVTRPATGLPVGGSLEFVDRETLSRALEGRREIGPGTEPPSDDP